MNQSYSIWEFIYRNKKNTTYKWCNPSFERCKSLEKAIKTVENVWIMLEQKVILLRKCQVFVYEVWSIRITNNAIRCLGISIGFNKEQCCFKISLVKNKWRYGKIFESRKKNLNYLGKTICQLRSHILTTKDE